MLWSMLRAVLLALALAGRCRGARDNSSLSPMLLLPPEPASRRLSAAQVHTLRRQLMRDNYDYQQSADERQPNITARSGGATKGGTDHLPRSSELAQATSNEFSAESGQAEHYKQRDQLEQRGQREQGSLQYEQRGQHEQGRHHKQPSEHEQRGQNVQQDQYEQHGSHKQHGQRKHHRQHQERQQPEQRGQNEHIEQQEQLGQFDKREQAPSIEQKPRTAPSLADTPVVPPAAVPFTDELTVRDVFEREYTQNQRDIEPDQAKEYNPSYKLRGEYNPYFPTQMLRRPFGDLRGNYKEQNGQNDADNDMRAQEELASNAQESPEQEYSPDEQEAFNQQDGSASQDDEELDFSVNKKHPKIYKEFVTRSTTRANRLQHYTPAPAERNAPPPHRNAPDHNISKRDLLYYMDDNQLRRRINDASPDVPDKDQLADDGLPSPQLSPGPNDPTVTRTSPGRPARRPGPTEGWSGGRLPSTPRARRSFVVTVSAANVTYKLLTLKSRSGRRQHERRILEERGPGVVALMSLDRAPLPAFRLPRARRQYMHAPHHHRRHEPA